MDKKQAEALSKALYEGKVGVMPTDTIYGLVGAVFSCNVEKIFDVKKRDPNKPLVILVSSFSNLKSLGIDVNPYQLNTLEQIWPGPISAILPATAYSSSNIHRGKETIAVRIPAADWLVDIIEDTGPIYATSANLAGKPTPSNIKEIKNMLPNLDFYYEGPVGSTPSKLVRVQEDGKIEEVERKN